MTCPGSQCQAFFLYSVYTMTPKCWVLLLMVYLLGLMYGCFSFQIVYLIDWMNIKEKHTLVSSLLSVLSCVTAALWSPDVWRVPTHQAGLQHQRGVCSLTQFWHYLPGDSLRSHRLKVQSHRTARPPTSDASCKSKMSLCASDWLLVNQGFPQPPPWLRLIS